MEVIYNSTSDPHIAKLMESVSKKDLCIMLAEEASELAQAAIKVVRLDSETIPTPIEAEKAWENVVEEYTDIMTAAAALGIQPSGKIFNEKCERWLARIDNAKKERFGIDAT